MWSLLQLSDAQLCNQAFYLIGQLLSPCQGQLQPHCLHAYMASALGQATSWTAKTSVLQNNEQGMCGGNTHKLHHVQTQAATVNILLEVYKSKQRCEI